MLKLLYITILFLIVTGLHAQQRVGVKVGTLTPYIIMKNDLQSGDKKNDFRLQSGITYQFCAFSFVWVQSELLYIQKGYKREGKYINSGISGSYQDFLTLNYIEIPAGVKLRIPLVPFYLYSGGYFAYCSGGSRKYIKLNNIEIDDEINFQKDNIRQFDWGIFYSIGYLKGIGPVQFEMDLRMGIGKKNISDYPTLNWKTKYYGLTIGLTYKI